MKNNPRNYLLAVVGIAAVGISSLAWTGNHPTNSYQSLQDTVPKRQKSTKAPDKEYKKDFDKEIDEVDRAMKDVGNLPDIDMSKMQAELDASMKKFSEDMAKHSIDMEKMNRDLKESLSHMDTEKMQADIQRSLKNLDKLDVEKLQKQLRESLSNLDADKMKADIDLSLKELDKIDLEKMTKEIQEAMKDVKTSVNPDEISRKVQESLNKVDMDKVKLEMEKVKEEMGKNKDNIKIDMDNVREDLRKTKAELKRYQEMVYEMEKDGLLKTSTDYTIEFKSGALSINGKKQSQAVTNKYKKYFSKDGITIRKEKGEMNINIQ